MVTSQDLKEPQYYSIVAKPHIGPSSVKKPPIKNSKKSDGDVSTYINIKSHNIDNYQSAYPAFDKNSSFNSEGIESYSQIMNSSANYYGLNQIPKVQQQANPGIIAANDFIDPDYDYQDLKSTDLQSPKENSHQNHTFKSSSRYDGTPNQYEQSGPPTFKGFSPIVKNSMDDKSYDHTLTESKNSIKDISNGKPKKKYDEEKSKNSLFDPKLSIRRYSNGQIEENRRTKIDSTPVSPSPAAKKLTLKDLNQQRFIQENLSSSFKRKGINDENIKINSVNQQTKEKIIDWLISITLLKDSIKGLAQKLPKICKNGLLFVDLINRLEGKHETIKGIDRNPKSKSSLNTNFIKILEYLKQYQKMNPRYLNAHKYLMEGNEDIFWGFLDDIWHFYTNKISTHDNRFINENQYTSASSKLITSGKKQSGNLEKSRSEIFDQSRSEDNMIYNKICYTNYNDKSKSFIVNLSPMREAREDKSNISRYIDQENIETKVPIPTSQNSVDKSKLSQSVKFLDNVIDNLKSEQMNGPEKKNGYQGMYFKKIFGGDSTPTKSNISISKALTPLSKDKKHSLSRNQSFANKSIDIGHSPRGQKFVEKANIITPEMETQTEEWLKKIGFRSLMMKKDRQLFEDPFRNGILLCQILSRVENEKINGIYQVPKTIEECRFNINKGLLILKQKSNQIPLCFLMNPDGIIQGDRNVIWGILYALMKSHEPKLSLTENDNKNEYSYDYSGFLLPYSEKDLKLLEDSLIKWLGSLGLYSELSNHPESFEELQSILRNGVLLGDLVSMITRSPTLTLYRKPVNEIHCITNIRKAFEALRINKNMSQKYLWKEKEIYLGNKYCLIGFLEDLHRFFEGLPPRQNPNYYFDGPYLGNRSQNIECLVREKEKQFIISSETRRHSQDIDGSVHQSIANNSRRTLSVRPKILEKVMGNLNIDVDEPISLMNYGKKYVSISNPSSKTHESTSALLVQPTSNTRFEDRIRPYESKRMADSISKSPKPNEKVINS